MLGTPTDKQWPGVTSLRDWHVYPRWEAQDLARAVPTLDADGVDLLSVCSVNLLSHDTFIQFDALNIIIASLWMGKFVENKGDKE